MNYSHNYYQLCTQFYNTNMMLIHICCVAAIVVGHVSSYRCVCNDDDCSDVDPATCKYGAARNFCHRLMCLRGPGEACSTIPELLKGKCALGLRCVCDECEGCLGNKCHEASCGWTQRVSTDYRYNTI